MKLPRALDGALVAAAVTGTWLFLGTLWFASYDGRMRIPENVIPRSPQTLVIAGFGVSMWLVVLGGAAILVREALVRFSRRAEPSTDPSRPEIAILSILVALFFLLSSVTSHAVTTRVVAGLAVSEPWGDIGLVLALVIACVAGLVLIRLWHRKDPRTASSPGLMAFALFLVVAFVAFGASSFGLHAADDVLGHRSGYHVVTFHTAGPSDLDNRTFFFVAQTPDGFYVRDLDGPASSDLDARFVPEGIIESAVMESRSAYT